MQIKLILLASQGNLNILSVELYFFWPRHRHSLNSENLKLYKFIPKKQRMGGKEQETTQAHFLCLNQEKNKVNVGVMMYSYMQILPQAVICFRFRWKLLCLCIWLYTYTYIPLYGYVYFYAIGERIHSSSSSSSSRCVPYVLGVVCDKGKPFEIIEKLIKLIIS